MKIEGSSIEREEETETTLIKKQFSDSIDKIKANGLDKVVNIGVIEKYWSWLTMEINTETPADSTFSCRICKGKMLFYTNHISVAK